MLFVGTPAGIPLRNGFPESRVRGKAAEAIRGHFFSLLEIGSGRFAGQPEKVRPSPEMVPHTVVNSFGALIVPRLS
jgi:hypothetical protein